MKNIRIEESYLIIEIMDKLIPMNNKNTEKSLASFNVTWLLGNGLSGLFILSISIS